MTIIVDITQLTAGTVKTTDVYPAVDTTDTTQALTGTTKKYTIAQLAAFIGGGGTGTTWNFVAGTTAQMVGNNGYVPLNGGLTTFTLPATIPAGQILEVGGYGSGLWKIAQNALQTIHYGSGQTSVGIAGYLQALNRYYTVKLLCVVANTEFIVLSGIGNLTIN